MKNGLDHALEERPDHADGLTTVVVRRTDARIPVTHPLRRLLDTRARRQKNRHAAFAARELLQELVIEEGERLLALHVHLRRLRGVECGHLQHVGAVEIARVERRIDGGRQPDEATPHALAERETQFELGARLVDFVDDERIGGMDVAILEPATRNAGGDDHHVPCRRFRCGFALAVHHPHTQVGGAENRLGDRADGERLTGAGAGDDAEPVPAGGEPPELLAAGALEECVDVKPHREFDRLARRACGRDDDDAAGGRLRREKALAIGGQIAVGCLSHSGNLPATVGRGWGPRKRQR